MKNRVGTVRHSPANPPPKPRRRYVEITLLLVLIVVALYFASGPLRTRYSLEHASLAQLEEQARLNPNNLQTSYYLARRARLEGHYSVALDAYKNLGDADPHDQAVWLEWAQTAALAGNTALAAGVLRTFSSANPQSAAGHAALADLYLDSHNYPLANSEASKATAVDPKDPSGWIVLGKYYLSFDLYAQAAPDFDRAISLAPDDWRGLVGAGDVELAQGRSSQAVALYSRAVDLKPDNATPYERLGNTLVQTSASPQDLERARQLLGQAIAQQSTLTQSDRVSAYLALGQVCEREAQWPDALTWLKKAETLNPANAPAHYELARVYANLGDHADSARESAIHETLYARATEGTNLSNRLKADPNDSGARLKLARLYTSYGDYVDAIAQYNLLLHQQPGNAAAKKELSNLQRAYPDAVKQAQASSP